MENEMPIIKKLRGYAEQSKNGKPLDHDIEETMKLAADVIEHLYKQIGTKKQELEFLKHFAWEAFFDTEVGREQFRCLWTAYCLHNDLMVDTAPYDSDLTELWTAVLCEEDTADWSDFDSFDNFMCSHLV